MSGLLEKYFDALKLVSSSGDILFYEYKRDNSKLPLSVHIQFPFDSHRVFDAWGNGHSRDEAFGKALMEMIERVTFGSFSPFLYKSFFGVWGKTYTLEQISEKYQIPIKHLHPSNSNGVAIHLRKKSAKNAALFELIERHTILYSLVEKIYPHGRLHKVLSSQKECDFYFWSAPLKTHVVVGVFHKGNGFFFSSGCDYDFDKALMKAELEINSFFNLSDSLPSLSFDIQKDDIDSFNRYHRYSGDDRIIRFLSCKSNRKLPELRKDDFYFCEIPQPSLFAGLPELPCVRVINPYVQQLFFDNWDESYLNPLIFPKNTMLPDFPHIIA